MKISICTQPLKKRSLASWYSFYERMDSIGSFLKQKLNGAVLTWVTMNQGWWLKNQFKKIYQHMITCIGALWGSIICFLNYGILSPFWHPDRPNGKSKNPCFQCPTKSRWWRFFMLLKLWILLFRIFRLLWTTQHVLPILQVILPTFYSS